MWGLDSKLPPRFPLTPFLLLKLRPQPQDICTLILKLSDLDYSRHHPPRLSSWLSFPSCSKHDTNPCFNSAQFSRRWFIKKNQCLIQHGILRSFKSLSLFDSSTMWYILTSKLGSSPDLNPGTDLSSHRVHNPRYFIFTPQLLCLP